MCIIDLHNVTENILKQNINVMYSIGAETINY